MRRANPWWALALAGCTVRPATPDAPLTLTHYLAALERREEPVAPNAKERATHTPGPWTVERGPFGLYIAGRWEDSTIRLADMPEHEMDPETEANARLMAAAPKLLAALEQIASENSTGNLRYIARRAIAEVAP